MCKDILKEDCKCESKNLTYINGYSMPSIIIVSGSTKSGKTTLVKRLIKNEIEYNNLIIFCTTLELSEDWDEYEETPEWDKKAGLTTKHPRIIKFSESKEFETTIKDIYDKHNKIIKRDGKKSCPHSLILCDDVAGCSVLSDKGFLNKTSIKMRHYNISCIVITQKISAIPRTLRLNCSYFIFMTCYNLSELERFVEEFLLRSQRKHLNKILTTIFNEKYNYILSDNLSGVWNERLYKNGKELIEFGL